MNNINIYGRIARDPEIKDYTTQKGDNGKMCNFAVAVNRNFGEEADFFNCRIFGKRAEVIEKYFSKGSRIALCGEMQCQAYTKDGEKKYPWVLMVRDFDFVDSKSESNGANNTNSNTDSFDQLEEDVPF